MQFRETLMANVAEMEIEGSMNWQQIEGQTQDKFKSRLKTQLFNLA